ncbi:uroporphyrinogen decarboxylase family protein [uncultured Robinsoniella sp.]|uniref:uroporphyrinogen decarboxylase family protein n=1 Tax=uncultured Robinsoniella sp. TaxID=904190 RepID=UPI00374FB88F
MKYDITFHPSWWHAHAGIAFTREFFDDPQYRMECDIKMRRALYDHFGAYGLGEKAPLMRPLIGTDLLAAGYLYSELMGCEVKYQADNSPQIICRDLDEDEIGEIYAPELETSEVWQRTQRQIDYLLDHFGYVESYINLQGIQNISMDLMGQEAMVVFYTAPEEAEHLLHEITKLSISVGKRLKGLSDDISGGVTAIVRKVRPNIYLTSNCSVEMISNDLYEKFLLPCDQNLAKAFGSFGVHHCGATMEHVVDGYRKIPGLEFAEVGAFSDLALVRSRLPGVFLNARYSPARLLEASEAEITREVQELAAVGQENGGLISVSCVGIDKNVSDDRIKCFLKACKEI